MPEIREYIDPAGRSPYARWFIGLDARAAASATTALVRAKQGNFSSAKGVGAGVLECRIAFGPGYRVCFSKIGDALIILLSGRTEKRQQQGIESARNLGRQFKWRKRREI